VLTQVFTVVLAVVLLAVTVGSYWLVGWYFTAVERSDEIVWKVLIPYYVCVPIGFLTLGLIWKLLKNIKADIVFTEQNVSIIRGFSWCLVYVGIVTFASGFFYLPYFIVCGASLFMCAIMRVLKNVMQQAVEVKSENDMTV
jgi:hypothetical protein